MADYFIVTQHKFSQTRSWSIFTKKWCNNNTILATRGLNTDFLDAMSHRGGVMVSCLLWIWKIVGLSNWYLLLFARLLNMLSFVCWPMYLRLLTLVSSNCSYFLQSWLPFTTDICIIWHGRYKGVIRIRKSKRNRQHNGQKKKYKRTNNDQQNTTHKTKDRIIRTSIKTGGELRCSRTVSTPYSTSATRRVTLVRNQVISLKWGKDREVRMTRETYPWSFVVTDIP